MTPKLPARTIGLKKRKIRSILLGPLTTILLCVGLLWLSSTRRLGTGKFITGVLGLFAGALAIFAIFGFYRLKKEGFVGLFLSGQGLNDISTGNTYGMVQWSDIYKIKITEDIEHPRHKYIILKVVDPQKYIDRETIGSKRRSMTLKFHYYGSPVCFSNRALDCSFDELYNTIQLYYENYRTRQHERETENVNA